MNPQYLFMGTADTLLETFWFLADSNRKEQISREKMSAPESCANLGRVNQQVQYYNICLKSVKSR